MVGEVVKYGLKQKRCWWEWHPIDTISPRTLCHVLHNCLLWESGGGFNVHHGLDLCEGDAVVIFIYLFKRGTFASWGATVPQIPLPNTWWQVASGYAATDSSSKVEPASMHICSNTLCAAMKWVSSNNDIHFLQEWQLLINPTVKKCSYILFALIRQDLHVSFDLAEVQIIHDIFPRLDLLCLSKCIPSVTDWCADSQVKLSQTKMTVNY